MFQAVAQMCDRDRSKDLKEEDGVKRTETGKGEAIHARHFHVQRDYVGDLVLDLLCCKERIGRRAHHLKLSVCVDDILISS